MKFFKVILYIALSIYIAGCIGLYFSQEKLLFRPHKLSSAHVYRAGEEVKVEVDEGIFLSCVKLKTDNPKGVILYLHGNTGSIRRCLGQTQNLQGLGYDVFMPDYREYGKSDGLLKSEKQMLSDIEIIFKRLEKDYGIGKVQLVAYSMGTGMATYLASKFNIAKIFLVAPYVSLVDLKNRVVPIIPSILMKYKFRSDLFLANTKAKIFILHGTKDEVIPFKSAERLKELFPERVKLYPLKGKAHRASIFDSKIRHVLKLELG